MSKELRDILKRAKTTIESLQGEVQIQFDVHDEEWQEGEEAACVNDIIEALENAASSIGEAL